MVSDDVRNRLEVLKDTYDLISGNNYLRPGDQFTTGFRAIQSQLPWEQGANGPTLTLDEPVNVGGVTIAVGTYGPQSLVRAMATNGLVVNGRSLGVLLSTPMPGAEGIVESTPVVATAEPAVVTVADVGTRERPNFLQHLVDQHSATLFNVKGGLHMGANGMTPPPPGVTPSQPVAAPELAVI